MNVTFIHHSGCLVELSTCYLLFDYIGGELDIQRDKPMMVFSSHRHEDHYSADIFKIKKLNDCVTYVLSYDISKSIVPKQYWGDIHFVEPDEEISINEVRVKTLRSTDEGVAFFVTCDGRSIYHAGDLNHWRWEGEDPKWNEQMARDYECEIEKLKPYPIDVAFLPLDPRQEHNAHLGLDAFAKTLCVKHIFPIHVWGDFSIIGKVKQMPCTKPYQHKLFDITKDGDQFIIEG